MSDKDRDAAELFINDLTDVLLKHQIDDPSFRGKMPSGHGVMFEVGSDDSGAKSHAFMSMMCERYMHLRSLNSEQVLELWNNCATADDVDYFVDIALGYTPIIEKGDGDGEVAA